MEILLVFMGMVVKLATLARSPSGASSVTGDKTSTYLFHFWWDRRQQYCHHWLLPRHQEQGKHIITTAIEHHAVLETIDYLVQNFGFEATIIQPENQEIAAQQIQKALRDDTILVSTMFANNETGNLLPIAEIGQILKQHPAAYHVDAVQALAKIPTESI